MKRPLLVILGLALASTSQTPPSSLAAEAGVDVRPLNFEWTADPGVDIPFTIVVERTKGTVPIKIDYEARDLRQNAKNQWEWPVHTDSPTSCAPFIKLPTDLPKTLKPDTSLTITGHIALPARSRGTKTCALMVTIPTGGDVRASGDVTTSATSFVLQYIVRLIVNVNGAPPTHKVTGTSTWRITDQGLKVETVLTNEGETSGPVNGYGLLLTDQNQIVKRFPIYVRRNGQRILNPILYPNSQMTLIGDVPAPIPSGHYRAKTTLAQGKRLVQTDQDLTVERDITVSGMKPWHWTNWQHEQPMKEQTDSATISLSNETDRTLHVQISARAWNEQHCNGWRMEFPRSATIEKQRDVRLTATATAPRDAKYSCTFLLNGQVPNFEPDTLELTFLPPNPGSGKIEIGTPALEERQYRIPVTNTGTVPVSLHGIMQLSPVNNKDKYINIDLQASSTWRLLPGQESHVIGDLHLLQPGSYTGTIAITYQGSKPAVLPVKIDIGR
jgi:hypothetical protein